MPLPPPNAVTMATAKASALRHVVTDEGMILDLRVRLGDGRQVHVEMQRFGHFLFVELEGTRLHSLFQLLEATEFHALTNAPELRHLELSRITTPLDHADIDPVLWKWALFPAAESEDEPRPSGSWPARSGSASRRAQRRRGVNIALGLGVCLLSFGAPTHAQTPNDDSNYDEDYQGAAENVVEPSPRMVDFDEALREATRHPDYELCHDPDYRLHRQERPLCPLAPRTHERCAGFEIACSKDPSNDRVGFRSTLGGRGGKAREDEPEAPEPWSFKLPPELVVVFRVLFWAVVVVLVSVVVYLLVTGLVRGSRSRDKLEPDAEGKDEKREAEPPGVVESDVVRLLNRAKAHAERGEYASAVDDVYAALLRYLEGQQLLVLERFRTNGDYIRALRQAPEWQRLVRDCGRDVERAQFGKRPPDASTFQRLLARIEPSITRGATLLLLFASSLSQLGCEALLDGEGQKTKRHWGPLGDTSADGLSLFAELLESASYTVSHRIRRTKELGEDVGMLVVYDNTSLEDEDWQALERWVEAGHDLWLAGDVEIAAHFGASPTLTQCQPPFSLAEGYYGARTIAPNGVERDPVITAVTGSLEEAPDFTQVLSCNGVPMVSQRHVGAGTVTVFADAGLLTNAALLADDNASVLMSLVHAYPSTVEFAGGLTGSGAESPYQALINANLWRVLLQIGLLMLVLYLAKGIPFATLRDPKDGGRRRFLDHLFALGRVFQRAHAGQHALHHYASWALLKLNERVRPGQSLSIILLGSALAKRTGRSESEVISILADAASARSQTDKSKTGEELQVLKKLEAFVIETGGAR